MDDLTLTDEQWSAIEPYLPRSTATTGRPMADRRRRLEGMLFQLTTGCPWRHLPRERFGPYQTVYHPFNRWRKLDVFDRWVRA
ncbi:MAG: transposase [Planctomycetota bacterium]